MVSGSIIDASVFFFVLAPVRVESFQSQINSKARADITLMACNLEFQQDLIRKRFY